jgi:hypothetical protein
VDIWSTWIDARVSVGLARHVVAIKRGFHTYSNAELKRAVDRIVSEFGRARTDADRSSIQDEAALLREELIVRLRGRGDDPTGVREPRRPRPGGGSTTARVEPHERRDWV